MHDAERIFQRIYLYWKEFIEKGYLKSKYLYEYEHEVVWTQALKRFSYMEHDFYDSIFFFNTKPYFLGLSWLRWWINTKKKWTEENIHEVKNA